MSVVSLTLVHKQFIPNEFSIYFLSRSWSRAYALWDHQVTSVLEKADPCDLISPKYPSAWNGVAWVGNSSIKEKKKSKLDFPACWRGWPWVLVIYSIFVSTGALDREDLPASAGTVNGTTLLTFCGWQSSTLSSRCVRDPAFQFPT